MHISTTNATTAPRLAHLPTTVHTDFRRRRRNSPAILSCSSFPVLPSQQKQIPELQLRSSQRFRPLPVAAQFSSFNPPASGICSSSSERGPLMDKNKRPSTLAVYLYIPNIIGYIRILLNCVAFTVCFQDRRLFSVLYFASFFCDALDGWFARKFNQVSTLGAVLDMLTDRISTACLLVILSQVYRPGLIFLSLLALDISSHWLQMYSTFLVGKTSHKDVKDSSNWLFRTYYANRKLMGYCCASCEVLYLTLFLLAKSSTNDLSDVLATTAKESWLNSVFLALLVSGWAIKQFINVIQIKTAADQCVLYDINKNQ